MNNPPVVIVDADAIVAQAYPDDFNLIIFTKVKVLSQLQNYKLSFFGKTKVLESLLSVI